MSPAGNHMRMGGLRRVKWDEREGCWYVRPSYADPVNGGYERKRHQVSGKLTEEEAQAACNAWLKREDRLHRPKRCGSLAEECFDYVRMRSLTGLKTRSVKQYNGAIRRYVVPTIGGMDVDEVDHYDITGLYADLVESGREDGTGLSPNSLTALHAVLRGTFKSLWDRGLVAENPMLYISRPASSGDFEAVALSERDSARLYSAMASEAGTERDRNMAVATLLGLSCGMRCGEVCAVRRRDLLTGGLVTVTGSVTEATNPPSRTAPKTEKSKRTLPLGSALADLVAAHIAWQDGRISANGNTPLVTVDGDLTRPSLVSKWFKRKVLEMDLPADVTFHSLRHTVATQMILGGEDMKTVSEFLGHANVEITLGTYAHLVPGRTVEAGARWTERIGG